MKTLEAHHPITALCAAFDVSRSGYYRWRAPKPSVRGGEDARLKIEIKNLPRQSRDTYVGWLFRSGQISEWEAHNHPQRTALQKALCGGNQFVDPQVGAVACEPGDMFLLCTDGLTDGLFDRQLLDLLRRPDAGEAAATPAQRLVSASLERAGRDNTTALIVEML
jgi:hypothetical protein